MATNGSIFKPICISRLENVGFAYELLLSPFDVDSGFEPREGRALHDLDIYY